MDTTILILMAVLLVGIAILLLRHSALSQKYVNGFYALCGALAWYTIETVDRSEPIYMSMLAVLLLCVLPIIVDSLMTVAKTMKEQALRREKV
jgi:threonine/homoserine/homoserine lactone efflux protein